MINYKDKLGEAIHNAYPKIGLDITAFHLSMPFFYYFFY